MRIDKFTLLAAFIAAWTSSYCLGADPAADIHAAAAAGDVQRLDKLLSGHPDLVNEPDAGGHTPLHLAARNLQLSTVETLSRAGADVNAADRDGLTALHLVLRSGDGSKESDTRRDSATLYLVAHGADVKAVDKQGKTPLHIAAMKGRISLLDLLLDSGADVESKTAKPEPRASARADSQTPGQLSGILNARDNLGRTPLHDAALYNQVAVIDWLVAKGADVNAADKQGDTPLHCAALRFRKEGTEQLIDKGANVNAKNALGATPLHVAASAGPEEKEVERLLMGVADVLLSRGAEVNAVDNEGFTPLHYAVAKDRAELAALLRAAGGEE